MNGKHPDINPEWQNPEIPKGYDQLVCCLYSDGSYDLDFVNNTRRDFASEQDECSPVRVSPFRDGFLPTKSDWQAIGIEVIDFG